MNRCVSWLLLLTHAVLLGTSGFGIWLVAENFGENNSSTPVPPASNGRISSIATYRSHYAGYGEQPKDYVHKTWAYGKLENSAQFYVIVPCGVAAATSVLLLLAGLCSRKLFTTTASLYSSLGIWILTLVIILIYQNSIDYNPDKVFPTAFWVLGIHVAMMLLLSLQVLLAMWELRRQKAGWPTINIMQLFTLDAILLMARLTLAVFIIISFCGSQIFTEQYPLWLSLSGSVAAAYSLVVCGEAVLSYFFGVLHTHMAWSTSLISAACNGWVAVMASPVFVKAFIGPYHIYTDLLILTVIASIVTFIHTIACLAAPGVLRTPPKFIKLIAEKLSTLSLSVILDKLTAAGPMSISTSGMQRRAEQLGLGIYLTPAFLNNAISCVVSVVLIIILALSPTPPYMWYTNEWGVTVLLAVNITVLCRTTPQLVLHIYGYQIRVVPFVERVLRQGAEGLVSLVGSIGAFVSCRSGNCLAVAGLQLFVTIIQVLLLLREYIKLRKQAEDSGAVLLEEESEVEAENTTTPSHENVDHEPVSFA